MNGKDLVGEAKINKHKLLVEEEQSEFKEQIVFEGKVAGNLWFNTKKGINVVFKELKGNYQKVDLEAEKKKADEEKKKKYFELKLSKKQPLSSVKTFGSSR